MNLDGQTLWATIDTGAARSSIRDETAQKLFHLEPEINTRAFGKLSIADLVIANPLLDVAPGRASVRQPGGPINTRFKYPDLVIGMDVLRKLHLYFAFQEKTMYVSPASAPDPSPAAGLSASPPAPAAPQ